ncbi:dynein light intermediate chain-domain-containing protein [Zopfochytrium polystomum]|nr:dynein light intermediate chain-domain-containing protein [Zopfochytrium polystomum]
MVSPSDAPATASDYSHVNGINGVNGVGGEFDRNSGNRSSISGGTGGDNSLWGSILKEASSSKTIAAKNVLVLGDSKSGKSTIINHLRQSFLTGSLVPIPAIAVDGVHGGVWGGSGPQSDRIGLGLALSFTYADVSLEHDDGEEPAARLSLYELESGDASFGPLVRFALPADKLQDSAVIICLDWSRPWSFFRSLERYLTILQREIETVLEASNSGRRIYEELRDEIETHFREYKEPEPNRGQIGATPKVDSVLASAATQHTAPLGPGILTNNLGIPIIIACTKSDHVAALEKESEFSDDLFDFVQQSLRTVCLKYGAALCYTSTHRPDTLHTLKTYLLHRLLNGSNVDSFPFTQRPQVVDRDTVFVPSGWDSWGMIKVLAEEFSPKLLAGLEDDGSVSYSGSKTEYEAALQKGRVIFEKEVPNTSADKSYALPNLVVAEDEQSFLERNLELLASMGGLNPSGTGSPLGTGLADGVARLPSGSLSSSDMLDGVSSKLAQLAKLKEQTSMPNTPSKPRYGGEVS